MKKTKEIVVTKRDGTVERFGSDKLSATLASALQARSYDPRLSTPLARAVALHLQEWKHPNPPTTEYIFRCVASVLEQTGLADVADDLKRHRRMRASRRRRTRVMAAGDQPGAKGKPWRKSAIVATLENHYGLRHTIARFLAGQIETQVFALDYRLITRPFLGELVRNEVLAWGLADEQVLHAELDVCEHPVAPARPQKEN